MSHGWEYVEEHSEGLYKIVFQPRGNLIMLYPHDRVVVEKNSPIAAYKLAIVEAVKKQVSRHEKN